MQRSTLLALTILTGLVVTTSYVLTRPQEAGIVRLDSTAMRHVAFDRLEVTGARTATLLRKGDGWVTGHGRAVEPQAITRALSALTGVHTSELVSDDAGRFAQLGVEGPQALALRASVNGETKIDWTLGRTPSGQDGGFAPPMGHVRAGGRVFAEDVGLLAHFDRDEDAWEDKTVLRGAAENLARLEVRRHGAAPYALRHDEASGTWQLEPTLDGKATAGPGRFDPQQAKQLVDLLVGSRASAMSDQDPGESVTGLGEGQADSLHWSFATATGQAQNAHTLFLGKDVAQDEASPAAPAAVWARTDDRALPFKLDATLARGLRRDAKELAELTLMARLDLAQVKRISFAPSPGQEAVFARQGEGWHVVRGDGLGKNFVVDPIKLQARIRQALVARALSVVSAPSKKELQGGGQLVLTLNDNSRHTLRFGRQHQHNGGLAYFAQGSADQQTYVASKPLRDNLLGKLPQLAKVAAATTAHATPRPMPQGLEGLPPEVQESLRRQLAEAGGAP